MKLTKILLVTSSILFFTLGGSPVLAQHKKDVSVHSGFVNSLNDIRSRPYNQGKAFSSGDWAVAAQFNYQVYGNFYLSARGNVSYLKTREEGIEEAFNMYKLEKWDGGKYKLFNVLVGLKYYMPVNARFSFNYALMGGIGIVKVTDIGMIIVSSDNSGKIVRKETYKFNNSFCLEGEVELDYRLSQHLSLILNLAYFMQTFNRDYLIANSTSYNIPVGAGPVYDEKMQANMFIPAVGVKYDF